MMREKPDFAPVFKLMDLFDAIERRHTFRKRLIFSMLTVVIVGVLVTVSLV